MRCAEKTHPSNPPLSRKPKIANRFLIPIYEFYCDDCNIIFNFLSSSVNTSTNPQVGGGKSHFNSFILSTLSKPHVHQAKHAENHS